MLLLTQLNLLALAVMLPLSWAKPLDAWAPPILYPDANTVWEVGQTVTVTWNVSNAPPEITNTVGSLYFVKNNAILLETPLATGFQILLGQVNVEVPAVAPGWYQLDLFGDSGNWSPVFQILETLRQ